MSQEYIASLSRGDQSNNPFLHPSLTADISEPAICDNLFCSGVPDTLVIAAQQEASLSGLPVSFSMPSSSISTLSTKNAIPSTGSAQSGP
jgi:hypothetical protein